MVDGGDEVPTDTLGKSADNLVAAFQTAGFNGLSVEANFALQMHGQARGKQFDQAKWGWLLASYLTAIGSRGLGLRSYWDGSGVLLRGDVPGIAFEGLGARRAVRVL